ncbi:hypothetical protein [Kitasatospora indigofera]|uniref:hypothetical protein n=1 Tax=Kitasatospora indigofera TaxID=67307 RepID=UPI0033ADE213
MLLPAAAGARYPVLTRRRRERPAVPDRGAGAARRRAAVRAAALLRPRRAAAPFPGGVLRPDFPASPAIPPAGFPLMVATMAERAYGAGPVPATAAAAGPPPRSS